jgi:hypothetical protein
VIDQSKVKEMLLYDLNTGVFTWKVDFKNMLRIGDVAGSIHPVKFYRTIRISGKGYMAHRLAWLYVHGDWPKKQIDHINRNRDDNRISNLRDIDGFENMQNRMAQKNSKSGVKGVSWSKRIKRWTAQIEKQGISKHLGVFKTIQEAEAAYLSAAINTHNCNPFEGAAR